MYMYIYIYVNQFQPIQYIVIFTVTYITIFTHLTEPILLNPHRWTLGALLSRLTELRLGYPSWLPVRPELCTTEAPA